MNNAILEKIKNTRQCTDKCFNEDGTWKINKCHTLDLSSNNIRDIINYESIRTI